MQECLGAWATLPLCVPAQPGTPPLGILGTAADPILLSLRHTQVSVTLGVTGRGQLTFNIPAEIGVECFAEGPNSGMTCKVLTGLNNHNWLLVYLLQNCYDIIMIQKCIISNFDKFDDKCDGH